MGQALYRKYRSRSLDEIVGQKPVVTALKNALKTGKISHAYLFTGPRGVGKTSIARILAFAINDTAYSDDLPVDIIEIDAASNRRIDDIRELRSKVHIAPVQAKYKVYIIDEVHMLTGESFNALLKTLEEPPEHVVFILATTEAHKLPETIISRSQRYSFKLADTTEVVAHLAMISENEGIRIDQASLEVIAEHSGGSLRDAISLLDQIRHAADNIDETITRTTLGLASSARIDELISNLHTDQIQKTLDLLQAVRMEGLSPGTLASQVLRSLRSHLSKYDAAKLPGVLQLMRELLHIGSSSDPYVALEVTLLKYQVSFYADEPIHREAASAVSPPLTFKPGRKKTPIAATAKSSPALDIQHKPDITVPNLETSALPLNPDSWTEALEQLRVTSSTLYSILRKAEPDFSQSKQKILVLKFKFPFHVKRMNEPRNKQIVLESLSKIGHDGYDISSHHDRTMSSENMSGGIEDTKPASTQQQTPNVLDQIRNVFGAAEVLE